MSNYIFFCLWKWMKEKLPVSGSFFQVIFISCCKKVTENRVLLRFIFPIKTSENVTCVIPMLATRGWKGPPRHVLTNLKAFMLIPSCTLKYRVHALCLWKLSKIPILLLLRSWVRFPEHATREHAKWTQAEVNCVDTDVILHTVISVTLLHINYTIFPVTQEQLLWEAFWAMAEISQMVSKILFKTHNSATREKIA